MGCFSIGRKMTKRIIHIHVSLLCSCHSTENSYFIYHAMMKPKLTFPHKVHFCLVVDQSSRNGIYVNVIIINIYFPRTTELSWYGELLLYTLVRKGSIISFRTYAIPSTSLCLTPGWSYSHILLIISACLFKGPKAWWTILAIKRYHSSLNM